MGGAALPAIVCFACGGSYIGGSQTPTPVDCTAQASIQWEFWGFNSLAAEAPSGDPPVILRMELAASVKVSVEPRSAATSACAAQSVESVTWTLSNNSVASITPIDATAAWLTAVAEGETNFTARIRFKDGTSQDVQPRFYFERLFGYRNVDVLRVVQRSAAPAGSIRILQGRTRLDPFSNTSTGWRAMHPFAIDQQGLVRVRVDWIDPRSRVEFAALGPCPGQCVVISPRVLDVKPLNADYPRVVPGPFTLRLDNLSSIEETVTYEVWLQPGG